MIIAVAAVWLSACGSREAPVRTTVTVKSTPEAGAKVLINGVELGTTPFTTTDQPAGQALIEVDREGYKRAWQVVNIENVATPQEFVLKMDPKVGYLSVDSVPPGAHVFLDGSKSLGVTPLVNAAIPAGQHRYRLALDGYEPLEAECKIEEDFRYQKNHALKPKGSVLEIFSVPTGARIWIDNQLVENRTPAKLTLPAGTYTVTVHSDGYVQQDRVVTLKPNEATSIELTMLSGAVPAGMVLVPAGEFTIGSEGSSPDEAPQRKIYLDEFYIDKFEVTNEQFRAIFPTFKYDADKANFPATGISYNEAEAYAAAVGKRLPTEEEWEKAARGTDAREYPWGNTFEGSMCNIEGGPSARPVEVGRYRVGISPYGCMDMAGNALEWTASWYQAYPGNQTIQKEYGQLFRVLRGGSFRTRAFDARCPRRLYDAMDAHREDYGFRCAMSVKAKIPAPQ